MLVDLVLKKKKVMIVGQGTELENRTRQFLNAKPAAITVVEKNPTQRLKHLTNKTPVKLEACDFTNSWQALLKKHKPHLIVAANQNAEANAEIARIARSQGKLVYAVDSPHFNDFNMPAVAKIGDINIAISTGGKSPAMAKLLRKRIEQTIRTEDIRQVQLQGQLRKNIKKQFRTSEERKTYIYKIMRNKKIKQHLQHDRMKEAINIATKLMK